MSFYNFSKIEIEQLLKIHDNLEYQYETFYSKYREQIENEKLLGQVEKFIESMNAYNKRLDIFKYQIFILVTADNWEDRLNRWVGNICPDTETHYHYYYQLYSLHAWISCIIPFSQRTVSQRIINATLETFGYDDGVNKIKILMLDETDKHIKSDLELFIQDDSEIANHKIEIIEIIQSNDPFKGLDDLTKKFRVENWKEEIIINYLCKFRLFINYHLQTKNNDSLMDTLNEYIERLEK